jgi:signal transduction histidine kinase
MFDLETTLLAITAAINLGLVFFIYSRNRASPINGSFALFVLCLSLWALFILGFRLAESDTVAVNFLKFSYVAATLIATCFYYFSLVFPNGTRPSAWHLRLVVLGASLLSGALLFPSFLTGGVVRHPWGKEVLLHLPEYLIFATTFCTLFLGGQARLWKKYFEATGLVRRQLFLVSSSVTVIGLIGMYYNLLLPSPFFHDFRYVWTGPIFTSVFALVITYSIFRYRLFDTKALIAELLVFSLWLIMFARALLDDTLADQITDAALFLVSVPIGVLLLRSVRLEVATRENLAAANERLMELDRMKSEFLSIATHQLRAPLTAMRGYVSLIEDGSYGRIPEAAKEPIERIGESTRRLAAVIDDYLNVSRIEQGRMKYDFADADLKKVAEDTVHELAPTAHKKGLQLLFDANMSAHYTARLDIEKIAQVIFNLLDNAIKYTPQGTIRIRLSKDRVRATLILSIEDTGVGIEPAILPRLFQKFERADDAGKTNTGGTGLGLYIARQIVEAHGGRVWVESKGRGRGSAFFVELPQAR